ncbi:MAG: PepSY domain-containing protein, partial [Nanoarchaeota archaeon]|nr:PepSY domain-containing protein [Nanoarchaeota archaeon]
SKGCPIYECPSQPEPIVCEGCINGIDTGKKDSKGCPIYECPSQPEPICPENCICKGKIITCPTTQEDSIEVEISTSEGSSSIFIEKIAEDTILIKEGSTSVKTSKKLLIEEKKLLMETSQGNKEVKIMPSTASETAINQLKLKNYEIELKDVGRPVYEITGKKDVKVIGFINAEMAIKSQINAETGAIEKTEKPWWSFLAKE